MNQKAARDQKAADWPDLRQPFTCVYICSCILQTTKPTKQIDNTHTHTLSHTKVNRTPYTNVPSNINKHKQTLRYSDAHTYPQRCSSRLPMRNPNRILWPELAPGCKGRPPKAHQSACLGLRRGDNSTSAPKRDRRESQAASTLSRIRPLIIGPSWGHECLAQEPKRQPSLT